MVLVATDNDKPWTQKVWTCPAVMAHAFNPSIWEAEAGGFLSKASLVYRVSSRTARVTQRNPVSNKQTKNKTKQKKLTEKGVIIDFS